MSRRVRDIGPLAADRAGAADKLSEIDGVFAVDSADVGLITD
jgi:hypothetical protein